MVLESVAPRVRRRSGREVCVAGGPSGAVVRSAPVCALVCSAPVRALVCSVVGRPRSGGGRDTPGKFAVRRQSPHPLQFRSGCG